MFYECYYRMSLLGFILLTSALCCSAAPALEKDHCQKPQQTEEEAELQGDWNDESYPPGRVANYICRPGYLQDGSIKMACIEGMWLKLSGGQCTHTSCGPAPNVDNADLLLGKDRYVSGERASYKCKSGYSLGPAMEAEALCSNGEWKDIPVCRKIGGNCGPAPEIEFGDITNSKREESYKSGSRVFYRCPNFYVLDGKEEIKCVNGAWEKAPVCLKPCTITKKEMDENNLYLRWRSDRKIYTENGQTIEFTCKAGHEPLSVISMRQTCNQGVVQYPKCLKSGFCELEQATMKINNINSESPVVEQGDSIEYKCNVGMVPETDLKATCVKGKITYPRCKPGEITCNQYQQVANGRLISEKSAYKEGDEIALQCNEGFTIQVESTKPRVCTSNGWSPPAACISRRCEEPEVKNGKLSRSYYFPRQPGSYIYYKCNDGFRTQGRYQEEYIYCRTTGWDPEPKCFKLCDPKGAVVVNGNVHHTRYEYLEGEKVTFYCHSQLRTPDGQNGGEITCLSDGKFSPAKCSSTCKITQLQHGKYAEIGERKELELGDSLRYECEDGYKSPNDNIVDSAQCTIKGWDVKPECKEINCEWDGYTYASGKRIQYSCPSGQRHSGSNLTQCFYYGLGPQPVCEDINCVIPEDSNLIQSPRLPTYKVNTAVSISCPGSLKRKGAQDIICTAHGWHPQLPVCEAEQSTSSKSTAPPKTTVPIKDPVDIQDKIECAPAHSPANAKIEKPLKKYYSGDIVKMKCDDGFKMHGSASIQCNDGVWESPPQCIPLRKCKELPSIINGKYDTASGRVVKYSCNAGYRITGSDKITCDDGKWTTSPICTGIPCGTAQDVQNAFVKERNRVYVHGESAIYQCKDGFTVIPSGSSSAECIKGQWKNIPTCVDTTCGPAPNVDNADLLRGKDRYVSGERASYKCKSGYSLGPAMEADALCSNGEWESIPVCRKIGGNCDPPPQIEFGDLINSKREETYKSGSRVFYQCPNLYVLEGKEEIRCVNGAWEKAPVCLKPCTITKKEMDQNNLYLRWRSEPKIYTQNGHAIEFTCKAGHEPLSGIGMRQTCNQGVVQYPKCLKSGFCELEQATMKINNINSESPVVEQGVRIEFKCNVGMVPETDLQATCVKGKITYPRCKAPEPCQISIQDINANNFQLESPSDLQKDVQHGAEVKVVCKTGFKRPTASKALCDNGKMKYNRCFPGDTCRLKQEDIDTHYLELHEEHDGEVYYGEGEYIKFTCKEGYHSSNVLIGKCSKKEISYPTCTE
ncbi:complement factor H-like isoform X3 [Pseudophryne corroboree]|uniref:complement factor H-like isoform X3 n=1 Tax=Pseudophryne corroboree TaxID=495146 RepID=UPI0030813EF7